MSPSQIYVTQISHEPSSVHAAPLRLLLVTDEAAISVTGVGPSLWRRLAARLRPMRRAIA